jgi:hypothetical protein
MWLERRSPGVPFLRFRFWNSVRVRTGAGSQFLTKRFFPKKEYDDVLALAGCTG